MERKSQNLIKPEEFIKNFPKVIKDISGYIVPKISYRTLRYYMTYQLMPKPFWCKGKGMYSNTLEMYKRLFLVWLLIHYRRLSKEQIFIVIQSCKTELEVDFLILFSYKIDFLKAVISCGNVSKAVKNSRDKSLGSLELTDLIWQGLLSVVNCQLRDYKAEVFLNFKNNIRFTEYKDFLKLKSAHLMEIETVLKQCRAIVAKTNKYLPKLEEIYKRIKSYQLSPNHDPSNNIKSFKEESALRKSFGLE